MSVSEQQKTKNNKNLVWMDLEMTGLDPDKEEIIEIATVITNGDLDIVAEGPNLVIHQSPKILKKMDAWNQRQHTRSGLIDKVKDSDISAEEAERKTLEFISEYCDQKSSPLCGNSIHHDRRFLIKYMPILNEYLHYRHVDVTTVKALVQRWYPKAKKYPKKNDTHRALADVYDSIEEMKFLRKHYFKPVDTQ